MDIYLGVKIGLLSLVVMGIMIQILGWLGLLYFRFCCSPTKTNPGLQPGNKIQPKNENFPSVSIIKPCYSNEDNEIINFEKFFTQDYSGKLRLFFVVTHESDPICPVVRALLKKYPEADAHLIISKTRTAYWRKVDALYDGQVLADTEIVIWSDSDAIVQTDYVTKMVAALQEPGVCLVTTPQYDSGLNNFPTALKTLGNNADVGTYIMIYNFFISRKELGWGHTMGFWLSDFRSIGQIAWATLNNSFADDLVLPTLFTANGKKVVYRNIYCPVSFANKSLRQVLTQQKKFALCQNGHLGPIKTLLSLLFFPQIWVTLNLLIQPQNAIAWFAFFSVIITRVLSSALFEILILKPDPKTFRYFWRYFWTIPIWDLLHLYFIAYALTEKHIHYHGKTYRFAGRLRLEEVKEKETQNDPQTEWAQSETDPASARFPS